MTAHTGPIRMLAPAKLTLQLRIIGTRADGYHLIDAEMVTLGLCDELIVYPSKESSVEVVRVWAGSNSDASALERRVPTDRSNLVMRALEFAGRTAHVEIRKRIPPAAGLGGGSADAAAVLRWANWLTASESRDAGSPQTGGSASPAGFESAVVTPTSAATLGADVAFCLVGGRARVGGIGEVVESLPFRDQAFVLWTPPLQIDTAVVYRKWDEMGGPNAAPNDLEPAAVAAYPELADWRDELAGATGRSPQLAGSGGTWFVRAPTPAGLSIPERDGISAVRARTIGRL